ncbi:transporter substrate-binding domain-containing protein [uncultured Desulfosarcina sp.]|uniref:substrate-binding periplasmic protein n=1 Tax=uncultured Desulfosarcina sp. TaxID=218289 RepID=UPI0029C83EDF|nr:transporter substrate-binding domain-containing protein [uncultured Desulfosarcina sp.]
MKKPLHSILLLALLLISLPTQVMANKEAVQVAVDAAYPPYMFGTSPVKGLYPEIIRMAFSLSGIPVKITEYPWKRALSLGREGKVAVGGIYQNLRRMALFDYSDPIYLETLRVWVKAGHEFPFSGVVDLSGKRVGINRGWSYGEVFDSARRAGLFEAEEATDNLANLKKLILGRLDCIIADELSLSQIIYQRGLGGDVEMLDPPAAVNSVHLVFAKRAKQTLVLDRFNQGLVKMKENGTYSRIIDEFIHGVEVD